MKKIILFFIIITVASTCFTTSATAVPEITSIRGGYGATATVTDAKGFHWQINITGLHMIYGMQKEGVISSDSATIHTPIVKPALGIGKINITVTINRIILPDVVEVRTAFMFGPFVLFVHNVTNECP